MNKKINIVAIIPARYASTRLPAKPLIDLCGKPMIQHVYERARQSRQLDRVIVATDHQKIADVVRSFGGEVIMTPESLRSGSDRIAHVAKELPDAAIIVNVQGDEPLLVPAMIDEAIDPLLRDASIGAGTLIKKITTAEDIMNPSVVKVVLDTEGFGMYFSRSPIPYLRDGMEIRRWHLQHPYYKHIGLYVYRRDILLQFASWKESPLEQIERLEQLRLIEHGVRIKATITNHDSIPVDTPEDVERVKILMQQSEPVAQ